jgi:hypothetical protein
LLVGEKIGTGFEWRVDEIGRPFADGAVEECDQVVASVEVRQPFIGHHHAITHAGLLAEHDDFGVDAFVWKRNTLKAGLNVRIEGKAQTDGVESRFSKSTFLLRGVPPMWLSSKKSGSQSAMGDFRIEASVIWLYLFSGE